MKNGNYETAGLDLIDRNLLSGRCAVQGELLLRRIHWK